MNKDELIHEISLQSDEDLNFILSMKDKVIADKEWFDEAVDCPEITVEMYVECIESEVKTRRDGNNKG